MNNNEIYILIIIVTFALAVIGSTWLVKRAKSEKRIHWFIGSSIVTVFLLGIINGPIAIVSTVALLAFIKKEDDRPLSDVGEGLLSIFSSGLGIVFYSFYMFFGVGVIYWLWLAIQLESFGMFIVGVIPFAFILTGPIGAYSLIFDTPQWIINVFG
ncbi:hypothetical protein FM038_009605 [Shewanella eurypsychrophilus]|uniref:Tripartite tricarboxylate transporter TctB family protein n=1 Tax=Shewanella eurypsychrophilus TaxID=2593656 RepID=A0ABX6V718_9GAMM|nr:MULTISPECIES: hypothetical protein [Shewanella]QFU22384.1 hypothetical protein FS418_11185 [Shewanella sp. YLB-09]QPG57671.1 hypothetical protein FM038_009605 [Shewanella eurypsychrophilus]